MAKFTVLLFLCLGLFACESKKDSNTPAAPDVPAPEKKIVEPHLPENWFTKALKSAPLDCKGECPGNIGMIALFEKDFEEDTFVEQCTGFAVAKNIVATNSHCVPEVVKAGWVPCESRLGFVLPKKNGERSVRLCKRVIVASEVKGGMDLDDYAFFEVEDMDTEPVKIAQAGIEDGVHLRVHKINPNEDGTLGGMFESLECKAVQKSLLNLYYIHSYSRTALAMGCEARGGNSGSPVFNDAGEVIGLLQSKKVFDYLLFLGRELARRSELTLPEDPPAHFVFSNLSCIAHPISGERNFKECDDYRDRHLAHIFNLVVDPSFDDFGTIKSKWVYKLPSAFSFDIETTPGFSTLFTATPRCVTKKFLESHSPGIYDFEFSNFLMIVKQYKFDEFLRFHPITYFRSDRAYGKYKLDITDSKPKLFREIDNSGVKEFQPAEIHSCE